MRATHMLIAATALGTIVASGQVFAQATGNGTSATPQTNGAGTPPGAVQGTPPQTTQPTTPQQGSQSGDNMSNGGMSGNNDGNRTTNGTYGHSRHTRKGTHTNGGTTNSNSGSSYPASGSSSH